MKDNIKKTKVYVLQKNDELWRGEANPLMGDDGRLVAALSSDQETVDDIIESVKRQEFPWNFDYYDDTKSKIETDLLKEDFGFVPVEDIGLERLNPITITNMRNRDEEDVKRLFIDLQHRKVFCLGYNAGYEPRSYPKNVKVYTHSENTPSYTGGQMFSEKTIPQDFTPIKIELNKEDYDPELQVATELFEELRECNHPSGAFFRSLGACVDQNYFWEVSREDIKWRPATLTEMNDSPSSPLRVREDSFPLKGRIVRSVPLKTEEEMRFEL
jgi:hypothetical protein